MYKATAKLVAGVVLFQCGVARVPLSFQQCPPTDKGSTTDECSLSPTLPTWQAGSLTLCTQPRTYRLTYVPRIKWTSTIPYWKYTPSRCVNEDPHRPNESNKELFHTCWSSSLSKCLTTCTIQLHCSVTWTATKPYPHVWCDNAPLTLHMHVPPHISGVRNQVQWCTK